MKSRLQKDLAEIVSSSRTVLEALYYIHLITKNSSNELVLTPDGENYVEKFDSER